MIQVIASFSKRQSIEDNRKSSRGLHWTTRDSFRGFFESSLMMQLGFYDKIVELYKDSSLKTSCFMGFSCCHKLPLMITDAELIKRGLCKSSLSLRTITIRWETLIYFQSKSPTWERKFRVKLRRSSCFTFYDEMSSDTDNYVSRRQKTRRNGSSRCCPSTEVIASCALWNQS